MPNIKQSAKRAQQNPKQRQHNKAFESAVKTEMKKFRKAVAEGDRENAEFRYRQAGRMLDKASTKRVMHRNRAARNKSRMARDLNAMGGPAS